ncbi:MAG: hypothetical protein AAF513_07735 [Pseudomonadota bacterium]
MADAAVTAALSIIGDGSLVTRQALHLAPALGYQAVTLFDDAPPQGVPSDIALRPGLAAGEVEHEQVFIACAEAARRSALLAEWASHQLVNLIHPSTVVSPSAQLGRNVLLEALVYVGMNARIEDGVLVNSRSGIEHDNVLGQCAFLGTGVTLCGHVTIGTRAFIGGGATVKPGVRVGPDVTLGTGAVLVADALEPGVYVGMPAKRRI